ncbi:MAG: hypothetical protein ACREQ5_21695 [Candidatus Dormibacteria bacterium]
MTNVSGWQDWQQRVSPFGQNDLLYSNNNLPNGSPQTFNVTLNALYQGLLVVVLSPNQNDMQVLIDNDGFIGIGQQQTQIIGGADTPGQFLFPMLNFLGDTVAVTIVFTTTMLHGEIAIYGVRQLAGVELRTDGRPVPQNGLMAWLAAGAAGTYALVGAPSAPTRVIIGSASVAGAPEAAGPAYRILATVEGATQPILVGLGAVGGPCQAQLEWTKGIVTDPGTQVGLQLSANGYAEAMVTYDLVV